MGNPDDRVALCFRSSLCNLKCSTRETGPRESSRNDERKPGKGLSQPGLRSPALAHLGFKSTL